MAKQIRTLPIAPSSARPATFNAEADAFVAALAGFVSDANALANEAEALSRNATDKSDNVDEKHTDLVTKYNDFIAKYQDFFAKFDLFIPKYEEVVIKHGETLTTAANHKIYVDNQKQLIDEALERAKSFINDGNGGVIDDTKISETSTYSSKKIQTELDKKMEQTDVYTRQQTDDVFLKKATANWLATEAFQKSDNGYMRLSNGFIMQWKKITITPIPGGQEPRYHEFVFPIAFPNVCIGGSVSTFSENGNGNTRGVSFYTDYSFGGLGALTNNKAMAILKPFNSGSFLLRKCEIFMIAFGY